MPAAVVGEIWTTSGRSRMIYNHQKRIRDFRFYANKAFSILFKKHFLLSTFLPTHPPAPRKCQARTSKIPKKNERRRRTNHVPTWPMRQNNPNQNKILWEILKDNIQKAGTLPI
jgi:hypothetical protein